MLAHHQNELELGIVIKVFETWPFYLFISACYLHSKAQSYAMDVWLSLAIIFQYGPVRKQSLTRFG